jgi:hypothetical protein
MKFRALVTKVLFGSILRLNVVLHNRKLCKLSTGYLSSSLRHPGYFHRQVSVVFMNKICSRTRFYGSFKRVAL